MENDIIKFIAYLGDGKGKVTRTYVLRGLSKLMTKWKLDNVIAEFKIRQEQIEKMMQVGMYGFELSNIILCSFQRIILKCNCFYDA